MQAVKQFDEVQMKQLAMVVEFTGFSSPTEVTSLAKLLGEFEVNPFVHNDEEYGKYMVEESGLFDVDELLLPHIYYASPVQVSETETISVKEYRALQKKMKELEIENEILKKLLPYSPKINNGNNAGDVLAQIEKLSKLKDAGILSEEEFAVKKAELLTKL